MNREANRCESGVLLCGDGCSSTGDFAARLVAEASSDEWRLLEEGGFTGEVSPFNRATLLRLRKLDLDGDLSLDGGLGSFGRDGGGDGGFGRDGSGDGGFGGDFGRDGFGGGSGEPFDAEGAKRMEGMLRAFLDRHMPDNPAASRWITLSCLALAFVFREPLHPVEAVKAEARVVDGETTYYCPAREGDETLCGYCVCRPMSELLASEPPR